MTPADPTPEGWPPPRPPRARRPGSGDGPQLPKLPKIKPVAALLTAFVGLMALLLVVMAVSGKLGFIYISDEEVGVHVDYLTGEGEVITTPGYKIYIPFLQEVYPLDRSPQKFLMQGTRFISTDHVPYLTVRASDGSNFWFESLEIQYALIPEMADRLLDDSGPGDTFKHNWIMAHARSALRDEFGRYSAKEVANPSIYQSARVRSTERLNEILRPHGIEIIQIINPKPKFDPQYEQAIDDRKVADQKVEKLKVQAEQLLRERERRLAGVQKDKQIEQERLRGELTQQLKEAERVRTEVQRSADAYSTQRRLEGEGERERMLAEAGGLEAKYTKEAEGVEARAAALAQRGRVVVREALIEKLRGVTFTLVPYSRDAAPTRLEHLDARLPARQAAAGADLGGQ